MYMYIHTNVSLRGTLRYPLLNYTDVGDCVSLKSLASDDPERNRVLDFYPKDSNEHTLANSTRSISTQSGEFEDGGWVIIDFSPTTHVSTQTDACLTSSQEIEMKKQVIRAQSYELHAAKVRYELMLKTQRSGMEEKIDILEAKLKERQAEIDRELRYLYKNCYHFLTKLVL